MTVTAQTTSRTACRAFLFFVGLTSLLLCPHSKVEESFQLQAVYDLFYHGVMPAVRTFWFGDGTEEVTAKLPYDHLQYPGVVPRTFVGPLILSALCRLTRILLYPVVDLALYPLVVQFLARFFLFAFNLDAVYRLASVLEQPTTGNYLLLVTASQFHWPFYASRMLPNVFAMTLATHAYRYWIMGRINTSASFLVVAMTVFRCDILLLVASVGTTWLLTRRLTIFTAIRIGLVTMTVSLLVTVPIDSMMWQKWTWPEGTVFYYNAILGKSSDWGTSPWYWYWTSALPKALLLAPVFVLLSVLRIPEALVVLEDRVRRGQQSSRSTLPIVPLLDKQCLELLLPAVGFVALYSCLGHKEVRFLFPVLPLFNVAAAAGLSRVHKVCFVPAAKDKQSRLVAKLLYAACVLALLGNLVASTTFVTVSKWNYPGGDALAQLSKIVEESKPEKVSVYVDVASAMTGVSLFGQQAARTRSPSTTWEFQKAGFEDENANVDDFSIFSHILCEDEGKGVLGDASDGFEVVGVVQGNPRLNVKRSRVVTSNAIYILQRKEGVSLSGEAMQAVGY